MNNQNESHIDKLEKNLILLLNRLKDNNNIINELNAKIIEVEKKNSNLEKLKSVDNLQLLVEKLEKSYAVRDKQDVLAMCALQFASQTRNSNLNNDINIKIRRLNDLISDHVENF